MYFCGTLDPVATSAGWTQLLEILDQETGEPVELAGASLLVEVRDRRCGAVVLSAGTDNGKVSVVDSGTVQISVPADETKRLRADTYDVGAVLALNGETRQLIIGSLPVVDGIVQ
jgi:hypothetical protein